MEKELGLESDMKVSVYNLTTTGMLGGKTETLIGEFSVTVPSLTTQCDRPQFFNLINEEGMFVGQILANFLVKFFPKEDKSKSKQAQFNAEL